MSHNIEWGFSMPVGKSGRLVIEIDTDLKRQLYQTLREDGLNLKDWFLAQAESYLEEKNLQTSLFEVDVNEARSAGS